MKTLYKFVFGAALAATLVLASCGDGGATVNFPIIKAPNATASPIPDGVKLEWDRDIEVESYDVYRRQAGGEDVELGDAYIDPATGKYYIRDLQDASLDSVKANTTYTYTVKAFPISALKETAATKVTVATLETFLAEGAELDPPESVAIELLPDLNKIKATVTPGAHKDLLDRYYVRIYRDGVIFNNNNITFSYPETTGVYDWTSAQQISGTYTARVWAVADDDFHADSKPIESEGTVFESLFGPDFDINAELAGVVLGTQTNLYTVVNYNAQIEMSKFRPGVTYTVERAPASKLGYATGDYTPVALSKETNSGVYEGMPADEMTADSFGYLGRTVFYDRTLPAEAGRYLYRVKAEKGGAIQYKPKDGAFLSIDPKEFAGDLIEIRIPYPTTGDIWTYRITPSIAYKNILPSDSKLVIYWMWELGNIEYGPYTYTTEFTKAEIEESTVKIVEVPDVHGANSTYGQAYLEFADGTRKNLDSWRDADSGTGWPDGIYSIETYSDDDGTHYVARLR